MALGYRRAVAQLEQVAGKRFGTLYIVGGGGNNHRLCQLAADYTGKTVVVGSSESTSLGNIAAQLKYFAPEMELSDLRGVIGSSIETKRYESRGADPEILRRYEELPEIRA